LPIEYADEEGRKEKENQPSGTGLAEIGDYIASEDSEKYGSVYPL
jgi:hypothetical protein